MEGHEHHARAVALLRLLIKHDLTTIYLCPITWMEYAHVFSKETFRKGLPSEFDALNAVEGWTEPAVRTEYYTAIMGRFEDILSPFDWEEIALTAQMYEASIRNMGTYNLDGQDAVHLACASSAGVRDLASFDKRFRRVDGLYLWNDQIHGTPSAADSTP